MKEREKERRERKNTEKRARAHRVSYLHVSPVKLETLSGQLVNVGSDHVAFSIAAQLGPEVVHHQEQHVGP